MLGEEIGQSAARIERVGLSVTIESDAALDPDADLVAQSDKVADRAEMYVGRLIPRVSKAMLNRHSAAYQ